MSTTTTKPLSKRFLIILFFIALPIFIFMRWDSSTWLDAQVQRAASDASYQLTYTDLDVSGLTVRLQNVHLQQQQNSLDLDSLEISPSFSNLISGNLGADVEASWLGNPISASVSSSDNLLTLTNIDAMIDVSRVQNLNIPAQLAGLMHLQGHVMVQQNTGLPQSGELQLTWNQAKAGLAAPEFTLGDYTLNLNSVEDIKQPWQWTIAGGSGVALNGSGTLLPTMPDPKQWLINGLVDTEIDNSNPSLAMMMQSMMGSTKAKFRISGSLGAPRTDIVR